MAKLPDFTDPRFLVEVGWFLSWETDNFDPETKSFEAARLKDSECLLDDFLLHSGQTREWLTHQTVLSVGTGCMGEIATWPAARKIAVDPLLYTYQNLEMLIDDAPGTARTLGLSVEIEDMPLLDEFADVVIARNCLDHVKQPPEAAARIWSVLKTGGLFYLHVDIGGPPTPDEPSPFTKEGLKNLLRVGFDIVYWSDGHDRFNECREDNVKTIGRRVGRSGGRLEKSKIVEAYEAHRHPAP